MSFTYSPKKKKKKRTCGFRKRSMTPFGRNIIKRRRAKKRTKLTS